MSDRSYPDAMLRSMPAFMLSRAIPFLGIFLTFSTVAHRSPGDLAEFSYTLAIFAVITAITSMSLGATGNLAAERGASMNALFSSGLALCAAMTLLAVLLCVGVLVTSPHLPGLQKLSGSNFTALSLIYIACIPFLILNTFLHLFHESSGRPAICSKIRTICTLAGCGYLAATAHFARPEQFALLAMGYFLTSEGLATLCLVLLSRSRNLSFKPVFCKKTTAHMLSLGVPIALGLAGQKVYFYLLNERLAVLGEGLVAQLAVFMIVIGVLMNPFLSLSQVHSLYVSKQPEQKNAAYLSGLIGVTTVLGVLAGLLWWFDEAIFRLAGASVFDSDDGLYAVLMFFIGTCALQGLTLAHLRAMKQTLVPQVMVNLIMLLGLLPVIYHFSPESPRLTDFLYFQGSATLMGVVVLQVWVFAGKTWPTPKPV
ncbi:hypothetical protein [Pseudomonas sp. R5(2019)]|uniref:hypothetical protein n=1 Tax=Pseudomonas sp. R5(2019) TaxID=2697566 RepID=UPI0014134298|nr:hypothetical protein [Pseudomonas sp. R5(2019)]NBA94047.1 hypothetical protein [Pseudomonas sp. R5(2019)]